MGDAWNDGGILLTASVGPADGSAPIEFPVGKRSVSGGRAGAERRYAFRNGQDYEDTGREPREYTYEVPLFQDVDEKHYPETYFKLLDFIESDEARGEAELVDPEHGPAKVRMMPYDWSTDPGQRHGGVMKLSFQTVGEETTLFPTADGFFEPTVRAELSAEEFDQQLAESGVTVSVMNEAFAAAGVALSAKERVSSMASSTSRFSSLLSVFKSDMNVPQDGDSVASYVDVFRRRIEATMNIASARDNPETGFPLLVSGNMLMSAVTDIGQDAYRDAPRVYDYTVGGSSVSMYELANLLLGSVERVQELIDLNPGLQVNFIPQGSVVLAPLG